MKHIHETILRNARKWNGCHYDHMREKKKEIQSNVRLEEEEEMTKQTGISQWQEAELVGIPGHLAAGDWYVRLSEVEP